jgi:hypothetical protein
LTDFIDSDIKQAYIEYIVPVGCAGNKKGITLDMGKFVTWAGAEVIEGADNINSSRSFLFTYAIPFTHTGMRATYKVFDSDCNKWTIGGAIYNGWDNVQDQNRSKTFALYSDWTPTKWFEMVNVGIVGNENAVDERDRFSTATNAFNGGDPTDPTTPGFGSIHTGDTRLGVLDGGRDAAFFDPKDASGVRYLIDTTLTFKPWCGKDDLILAINADYASQAKSTGLGSDGMDAKSGTVKWYGAAAYVKWQFCKNWYLGVRGEYFNDKDGARTGIPQFLMEGTATLDWALTDALHTRLEFRHDKANRGVFSDHTGVGNSGPDLGRPFRKDTQNTIMMNWLYKF